MKTILLNSNTLWSIMQFRKELIKVLQCQYRIVCVAGYDDFASNSHAIAQELGVELFQIKMQRKGVNPLQDVMYFWRLLRLYHHIKPDLILHYTIKPNIYGSFAARWLKIPHISIISGLGSAFLKKNSISKIVEKLYTLALTSARHVLFLNQDDLDEFTSQRIIDLEKSVLLPGEGIDIDVYLPCPLKEDTQDIVFLMVARLLRDKGVYEYIEAIKHIRQHSTRGKFLLAGIFDEDNPTAISKEDVLAWEREGYITYLGKTDMIQEFFVQCDVVVLPSYREGLSRVLLEANSCEKFIITSDIAGCKELCMHGENGYLVQPHDVQSLVEAMKKTMSLSREVLQQGGKEGRLLVREYYSTDRVNAYYTRLIKEVL
ncbi:MAG: glycosyltransferase family 4 protein [Sulfurospirillaceae bacterium]|nr:glycosyltransferase family 4 protein [Sulfurospirillaceae bacterium]MDD2826336.1 glycosyltransferase family 4 protein [Sulfurospirillaceae bacterium]